MLNDFPYLASYEKLLLDYQTRHAKPKRTDVMGEKQTRIRQSPLNPPDRATTFSLNPPDCATTMTFVFRRWSGQQLRPSMV